MSDKKWQPLIGLYWICNLNKQWMILHSKQSQENVVYYQNNDLLLQLNLIFLI